MLKKNPKLSVILPAFNDEKVVDRCLQTIKSQTFKDFEVIVINDASTDDTFKVIQQCTKNDTRFQVFDFKQNRGVAEARNFGLKVAKGEFVTFIDSDDVIHPRFFETLVALVGQDNKIPLVSCVAYNITDWRNVPSDWYVDFNQKLEILYLTKDFDFRKARFVCWGTLYRKDVVRNLTFDKSLIVGEDAFFWTQAFVNAGVVEIVNLPLYGYVVYPESTSHGELDEKRYTEIIAWEKIGQYLKDKVPEKFTDKLEASYYGEYCLRLSLKYFQDKTGVFKKELYSKAKSSLKYIDRGPIKMSLKMKYTIFVLCPPLYKVLINMFRRLKKGTPFSYN